jgi:hypothetical protein
MDVISLIGCGQNEVRDTYSPGHSQAGERQSDKDVSSRWAVRLREPNVRVPAQDVEGTIVQDLVTGAIHYLV